MTISTSNDPSGRVRAEHCFLLAGTDVGPVHEVGRHREIHGPITRLRRNELAGLCEQVGLRGRGGAGFPTAVKLRATAARARTEIVVNVSEGEPASHKDRYLGFVAPHLLIDGALATARALRTRRISIVVRDGQVRAVVGAALSTRTDAHGVRVVEASPRFIAGEVGAMLRGLQGEAPVPRGRRTLPSAKGLNGNPTFASNAETFAQLGLLATHGADGFLPSLGGSESGTMLVTAWGAVPYAGVREVRAGTELSAICGSTASPVLVGGYHGTWVPDVSRLRLDRATLAAGGVHMGAGVFARLPSDTCALGEVTRVAHWLSAERSGQCGPCHFGLPAVAADLETLLSGRIGSEGLQRLRRRIGLLPGRGACAHPDGTAQFVRTALTSFEDEVAQHLAHGTCGRGCRGVLPLEPVGMAR